MEVPSTRPYFSDADIAAISGDINSILKSGRLILGPFTEKFENAFKEYCGVKYAVAVSSCTAALDIVLRYFIVSGKEVIVPTNTFIATSNPVIYNGGLPVLADIKADNLCLDPAEITRRITPRTRGVIVVHLGGMPCSDIFEIREICRSRGLFLLEDVAHAHGATLNGQKAGSFGDAGCFSFYPTKVMTTCTGGMITTNNDRLAEFAVSLRHHGVGKGLHHIINLGYDWLMDEISASLGYYQLQALESNLKRRQEIAQRYAEGLAGLEGVQLLQVPDNIRHSYYKYPVFLSAVYDKQRFVEKMQRERGIGIGSIYDPPCHLQPVYQRIFGFSEGMFPVAEIVLKRTCCLPMFSQMTDNEVDYVLESMKAVLPGCRASPVMT
ncbi:MAG: DegT/DnrJ/EryC1/StrS family aminotransferase [Dehalococcoidales bacterium]|nr:DegT/DnrJ/EryC1/StrS family aminotransferase [Dehalococcoidales bacterium]